MTDLLIQTGNFLIPIVSLGVLNSILRFGLEDKSDKAGVFTTGLLTIGVGMTVLTAAMPLIERIDLMEGYAGLLMLYVFMAQLHSACSSMAQSLGRVKLYAVSGILSTALMAGLNILFLSVFRMGIEGYMLSNVLADCAAALLLTLALRLWRFFKLGSVKKGLVRGMFRYCLPLIPAAVCTWVINISDRYFISYMIGTDVSGLYAIANKVATVMLIVSGIFTSAWQLSAVADRPRKEQEHFFSNVFSVYEAGVVIGASALIAASKLAVRFLAAPGYFEAWHYAPVLILGTAAACLGSFFSSVYTAEKHTGATLVTSLAGAAVNVVGNGLLIPRMGAMGAAVATAVSYLVILVARAVHSGRLLRISWNVPRFVVSMVLMVVQCWILETEGSSWLALIAIAAIAAMYMPVIMKMVKSGAVNSLLSGK